MGPRNVGDLIIHPDATTEYRHRFQSDLDYDFVNYLSETAGLAKLEAKTGKKNVSFECDEAARQVDHERARTGGNKVEVTTYPKSARATATGQQEELYYTLYAPLCSDKEVVRQHLDETGIIGAMMTRMQREIATDTIFGVGCCLGPAYQLCLLGSCAMTLGVKLTSEERRAMRKYYQKAGFMRDAIKQIESALDNYENGKPWDFGSIGQRDNMAAGGAEREDLLYPGTGLLNCRAPDFDLPGQDVKRERAYLEKMAVSVVAKKEMSAKDLATTFTNLGLKGPEKDLVPKKIKVFPISLCGGRGTDEGAKLQACGKCKRQLYCSTACQKAHWAEHKKTCKAA